MCRTQCAMCTADVPHHANGRRTTFISIPRLTSGSQLASHRTAPRIRLCARGRSAKSKAHALQMMAACVTMCADHACMHLYVVRVRLVGCRGLSVFRKRGDGVRRHLSRYFTLSSTQPRLGRHAKTGVPGTIVASCSSDRDWASSCRCCDVAGMNRRGLENSI